MPPGLRPGAIAFLAVLLAPVHGLSLPAAWRSSPTHRRAGSQYYKQRLQNHQDLQYMANITIGNQVVSGVPDTGSFELLVFSQRCVTCGNSSGYYNDTSSQTYRPGPLYTMHSFGSGTTHSQEAFDSVCLGPFGVEEQYFWEVIWADMPILQDGIIQAVIGLGPPGEASSSAQAMAKRFHQVVYQFESQGLPVPTELENQASQTTELADEMAKQESLLESLTVELFSVCLQKEVGSDGFIVWNDVNPRQQLKIFTRIPVVGKVTWGMQLDSAAFRGDKWSKSNAESIGCSEGCGAIADTGTSLLSVPVDVAQKALEALNAHGSASCERLDELPNLEFDLGGIRHSLPPEAYIGYVYGVVPNTRKKFFPWLNLVKPLKEVKICTLLLMTMDVETQYGPLWILGMPFMREYYTTFDIGKHESDSRYRSIWTAEQDGHCGTVVRMKASSGAEEHREPIGLQGEQLYTGERNGTRHIRSIDLSKIRVSRWAQEAAIAGHVTL